MRKIHITEEQLDALKKRIEESNDELTIDAQPDSNGSITTQGLKNQYNDAKSKVGSANVKLSVDGADLTEGEYKSFTKKQIKEARLKYLKENSVVFKKKNIK